MYAIPKRRLGRTGLSVTEMGLGTYQLTNQFGVPRAEARRNLDRAIAAGVNFIDTAPLYGAGESEELTGAALARTRRRIHVSTKIGCLDTTIVRFGGDAAYRDESLLRRVVEHSLHLLRRERADLLMIHEYFWPQWGMDRKTGDAPVMRLLESLKREGIIGAIGLGGKDLDFMADLIETGRFDVVLINKHYDLAVHDVRYRVLPAAKKHDVGVIIGGPFRQGVLAAKQRETIAEIRKTGQYRLGFENEDVVRRVEAIYDLSDETGIDLPEMAIRFLLADPQVGTVIPGPRAVKEFETNLLSAAKGPLPNEVHQRIEQIGLKAATIA
jgi:aryl-alcohol dehydrogenase-like predicted oxidoreductase